ncbi:uncharacterized protein LOC134185186 [Corticium candelabrum]|uniref:uncharacterized protein LOC134185186 n=1 Tax=Corticium candelabrum TaxID=121492 RepID=UPI002E26765F|nr:uncharacterized protein LOC134185186 [Corticium candelabrum]
MSHSLRLLTTARYDYTLLSVKSVSFAVEPLSTESATQLLLNISSHTNFSVASSLANLTGRAALAIKIVGALLKEGELADQLANELAIKPIETLSPKEFQPEDQIRLVIASSFRRLSKSLTRCIAIFAQIPGSFDKSAAAAVLNVTTSEARKKCLKPIAKRCLLEFNDHVKRYYMHKLIKAFVIEELGVRGDRQFVRDRFFVHYFRRLIDLAGRYNQNPREVLRSYDNDQHNFYYVLFYFMDPRFAVTASDSVRQSVVTLSQLAANLFLVRLPAGQLFRWYRAAREYAVRLPRSDEKNNRKYCDVMLLLVRAATKEANRNYKITTILEEDRYFMLHCDVNLKLKIVEHICLSPYELTDIPDGVLDCYSTHALLLSLPVLHISNFWNLGILFHNHSLDYAAYLCFVKAGLYFGKIDKRKKMTCLKSVVEVFERHDQHTNKPMLLNFLDNLNNEEMASSRQSHKILIELGSAYHRLSNYESAIPPLLHAYEMIKDLLKENDAEIFRVCYLLGKAYFAIERNEKAANYLNKSLLISKTLYGNDHSQTAVCHVKLADALKVLNVDEALTHWMEAARIYETVLIDDLEVFWIYKRIGDWQFQHFCPYSGAKYYYKAHRILYKTNGTKLQPETVSSTTTRDLQTSPSSVTVWTNVAAKNVYDYVDALLSEDEPFKHFYGSLIVWCLVYFPACFLLLLAYIVVIKLLYIIRTNCFYVRVLHFS